jgi:hypothetical protein
MKPLGLKGNDQRTLLEAVEETKGGIANDNKD